MKSAMFKSIVAATAVMAGALFAHGDNVSSVTKKWGTLVGSSSPYTASGLAYKTASEASSACYRNAEGWYAGILLNWASNKQGASNTKAKVEDGGGPNAVAEYQVYRNLSNQTPSGSGMKNVLQRSGLAQYMATTEWNIYVTPEFMYSLAGADYSATLTIGNNVYTITVPHDIVLSDGTHQWYPAVGLLGDKVYGEAQYLADQIGVENYTTVKFLSEPVGVTFGDGFAASDNGDGTWGVTMTHSHAWSFAVSADGATLTATCGNAGCPVGGAATVSLALSSGDKTYDGAAITASADFDELFETLFPNASTAIAATTGGAAVETMKDAGEYTVTMTVAGLGDDQEHVLSRTVTVSRMDISGAALVLTPATATYNGAEQTVAPSVTVGGLAATVEVDAERSTLAATEIGTYSVTVNGTGNFTGTTSGTWGIVNTTGSLKSVAATTGADAGSYADGTLTVTDTTALAYEDGVWTAGLTLTWPMESNSPLVGNGYGHYVKPETMQMTIGETVYTGREIVDSEAVYAEGKLEAEVKDGSYTYYQGLSRRTQNFSYLSNSVWTVAITPAVVEAALADEKNVLEYTMRAGALVWGDSTEGDPDGVAFADYKIELSLEDPIVFALGEGETHDLGNALLTTTRIKLAPGASVTGSVAQTAEDAIFIETPGYDVVWSESYGVYTYTTQFTHMHDWSAAVAANGYELVATCANPDCDMGGEVKTWLDVGTTEKTYDGSSVTRKAEFGEGFMTVYPDAAAVLTVNGVENGVINDAGEYAVALTVTGVGEGTYTLSRTVTVSQVDITGAALVLTPATTTYNGAEQTVSPSVTVGGVTATLDNHGLEVAAGTCAATEIGTYPVTVNGTGNFTGTATATWEIKNTTGESGDVAAIAESCGRVENNTLTVTNTTALVFSDGAWYAGLTLAWPMEKKDYSGLGQYGHAHYVATNSYQLLVAEGEIVNETAESQYQQNILGSSRKDFVYLDTTTWKVALTPAIIEAALAEGKTSLDFTMNAGAFVWGDSTEGDPDGVAFADYAIAMPLDEPVVFALGEGEAHDLGATMLTTTKIQLAVGASVTSDVSQTEGTIFTTATGYGIVCTEEEGQYVYTTKFTHVHDWTVSKAANGYELVATCANPECDVNGGEVKMWLDVGATEKTYDGNSVTRMAAFGEGFTTVYPDAAAVLTVNGVENGVINDAGEYAVALTVTGVGEGTYTLSRTVTVLQVDITGAALVLTPATTTYNGAEQTVSPSVTVGGVTATLDNHGLEVAAGTCAATEIGTYSVTVNGTGNFAGTAASANWSILNTTGEPASVTASAEGSMTNEGNAFTLADSSKLEYDAENDVWHAGITIAWPMEKNDSWTTGGYAHYVSSASVRVTVSDGSVSHVEQSAKFRQNLLSGEKDFTYLSNTTWRVALTPAIIEAALAGGNTSLDYTMNAGAFVWGNSTEGDPDGVAFRDYTITIPLEGIALYDGDGRQVYPKTAGQTIIEDIKDDIAEAVSDSAVAESAKAKIDLLAEVAGEGHEQDVADWVDGVKGESTPAAFFAELAQSDYVKASFELGTGSLITETSEVAVAEFGAAEGGFAFAVSIDGDGIEAARVKAAGIVQAGTDLDSFGPLSAERIEISESGEMTVRKDPNATREFFKIVIERDVKID